MDGCTIWSSITSNYLATNGQYVWTVPQVSSNTVRVRVRDASNSTTTDQSNANFTINIPVILTSPNGGETWQGNTVHNITWNAIGTSNVYTIQYSTNNGSSWISIVTNHSNSTGSYAWTVPNTPSTTCLVRVYDYTATCMSDVSNAVFEISPATPILLSPNGGESLVPECTTNITWDPASFFTLVRLDYSTDGGTTWNNITTSTTNNGSYTWTVPFLPGSNWLIKASNYSNVNINDVSNGPFTIAQPYEMISPNGGETLYGCSSFPITFNKPKGCVSTHRIEYSTDSGSTWNALANVSNSGSGLSQTYNWSVPNGLNSTTCLFRVSNYYNSAEFDVSDAIFSIQPSNDITVTAPNGGQVFQGLTTQMISWTNLPSASGQYNVQYSTNNGVTWTTVATNITGNNFLWNVPNNPSNLYLVKVIDYVNTCKFDISDATFEVEPVTPVLLSPNGGETLYPECSATITWNPATFFSPVKLEYTTNNGTNWNIITSSTTNNGSYSWTIPFLPSNSCRIKASNTYDLQVYDISDTVFTIARPYQVLSPNGGDTLYGCSSYNILFNKPLNCVSTHRIEYTTDNGTTWNAIVNPSNLGTGIQQNYYWTVPNGLTTNQCLIRVSNYYNSAESDTSNATFTILPSNDITVTSANGGEVWQGLSTQTVTWTNLPAASGTYHVQFSTNGGSSWFAIANNVTGNSTTWSVPNIPSNTCLIKVVDVANTCKFDVSNAFFTISPATPILTSPNGGESYFPECSTTITWNSTTFYSNVRLEYSTDNGTTWVLITSAATNNGSYSWLVPFLPSNTCKIKASNSSNVSINDVSNGTFTILEPYQMVNSNGGDTLYGCSSYPITFNKPYNCISTHRIEYSTDNGATWLAISNPSNSTVGLSQTFNWTVPNGLNTNQCLFRVSNYYNSAEYDISNANFTILPSNDITVTSPNGGEVFLGLTTQTITWSNLPAASGFYTVQYSLNGGSSWTTLATGITGNSYAWTLPNSPSNTCKVKVIDYSNTCKFDVSDANFTINPATPILLTPNGGEDLIPECTYNITWNPATFYSNVRIEYSLDGGTTWQLITSGATNSGNYSWSVPFLPSNNCLIKASNSSNVLINDVSNAPFSIVQPYEVITPNGGDTLYGCSNYPITFNKPRNCASTHKIEYSTDNGATWISIINPSNSGSGLSQTYNWTVPNGISSNQCLIRASNYYNSAESDTSDAVFTIAPSNDITVTSANGGEVWQGLSSHLLTWTNLPSASGLYTIQYSSNGGSSWTTIATNISGNAYNWSVPNQPSTSYMIKVIDYGNTCKFDVSDAVFTVSPATPILLGPNGGETLMPECSYTITWNPATFFSSIRLEYSTNNGTTWNLITSSTTNNGSYSWSVPFLPSTNCLIKASNTSNLTVFDVSNAVFTIAKPYQLITPNGGDTLFGCTSYPITFNKPLNCASTHRIEYSTNNGSTWNVIANPSSTGSGLSQTYYWTAPNNITSTQCLIRVSNYYNSAESDTSNSVFAILPSNDITVTSANGGESWQGLSTQTISWTNLPSASGNYTLQYSTTNGSSWNTIASNISGNSYAWSVPNSPSSTCLIKVLDYANTCKYDISDANFTISPAQPLLLTPNGGEDWYSGTTKNITWNTLTYYSSVRLEYSTDNGATWILITSSTSNNGSYNWTVPNVSSTQCLIKASNSSNTFVNDVSDAVFRIRPAVTILTPNGDNGTTVWGGCTVTSITFDRSNAWDSYRIEYTTNNGTTWNVITNYWSTTANPATYNWNIPNLTTSQAKVKVSPYYASSYYDESDSTFTVTKPVTLIQPNFGGILQVGSVYPIIWQSDGISNVYDLFYSTNNGSTWTTIATAYNTSTNTYNWTVPNTPSTTCLMRVRDNINNCKEDTSNVNFTISTTAPPITLLTPNGNDTIPSCQSYNITWSETSPIGTYDIAYSTNGGGTWTNIVTNYATATLNYAWDVPNINSSTVLVRVQSSANNTIFDWSNANFRVEGTFITALPASTTICDGASVQLTATGVPSYSWTPSTNLSCSNCPNPIASPTTSTQYTVTYSNAICTVTDTVEILVNPIPTAPTPGSNSPVSLGNTINLTASTVSGATYYWTGPNGFSSFVQNPSIAGASAPMAGVYTVIATVNGCSSTPATVTVVVGSGPAVVSGSILHPNGTTGIRSTTVDFSGTTNGSLVTGLNGQYSLSLTSGGNYVLSPSKANDTTSNNGITTLDLVLMQRHILNQDTLNSPYKIIAGDVNNSGNMTTLDIVLTRTVILQTNLTFPNGRLWYMVDADYVFPNAYQPWGFPETRTYSNVATSANQNFVGVKMGDVNWSWNSAVSKVETVGEIGMNIGEVSGKLGELVTVPITVQQFAAIAGYQFSMEWNPNVMAYEGYSIGKTDVYVGETKADLGKLIFSWNEANGGASTLEDGSIAFELKFRLKGETGMQTDLQIKSNIVNAEAYNDALELLSINSNVGKVKINGETSSSAAAAEDVISLQNYPNPFAGETTISFELTETQLLNIVVSDLQGRRVRSFDGLYKAGLHQIVWDGKNESGQNLSAGTYILSLESSNSNKSIRMVLLRD